MKESTKFDEFNIEKAIKYGENCSEEWNKAIETVLKIALSDKRNLPKLGFPEDGTIPLKAYVEKWVKKYYSGYNSRPSIKKGKAGNTSPDIIIGLILKAKLPNLSQETINKVVQGHSLLMSIENLLGALLEEYLSIELIEDGWFCCWGSTLDAIDFCKADGSLLQVKTSDNSENSSSSRVRNETTIEVWFRRNSKKAEAYFWDELNDTLNRKGAKVLSEEKFRKFVEKVISENPACFYVPDKNILKTSS